MAVVPRKAAKRLTVPATAAISAAGSFVGLSRVAPESLAVLSAMVVVVVLVLAFTAYKLADRLLQHLEHQSQDRLHVRVQAITQKQEGPG
jgi:hypothetical protein